MASQEPVSAGQEGNKEERYRKLLTDLAEARQDPLFQSLVSPPVEGPALPFERDMLVEEGGRRTRERSHHTQSRRSSSSRHESNRRSRHTRRRTCSLSTTASKESDSNSPSRSGRTHRRAGPSRQGNRRDFKEGSMSVKFITFNGHYA